MIIGFLLALACGGILLWVLNAAGYTRAGNRLPSLIMGGYVLRLLMQFLVRDVALFSHAAGGDSLLYESFGQMIAVYWRSVGVHFVTAVEMPDLGATTLPENLFALVIYANGGETTRLGCTALVALAAALAALNLYSLAREFGATHKNALLFSAILYLEPAFLFYSCDSYKDALVLVFAIGSLGSALRLSQRFSLIHAAIGVACLYALWYVRFYLVFVTLAPLVVGVAGIGSKNIVRPLIGALAIALVAVVLAAYTDILQAATDRANTTFDVATARMTIDANARGGSGVIFDDGGSPYGALPQKLAYTLFAPFPWATGSIGFHIGKLDAFLWYFIFYRAVRAAMKMDRRVVLMFGTFIVPSTIAYSMTVSNVGLIMRQRLVIVAATAVLAAVYVPAKKKAATPVRENALVRALRARRARLAAAVTSVDG